MKNGIQKLREIISQNKKFLEESYKVKNIGVFGSYAKGCAHKNSDIDILVDFSEIPDMFKFIELEYVLRKLLGRKVDLVTPKALKPLIKSDILKETIYL